MLYRIGLAIALGSVLMVGCGGDETTSTTTTNPTGNSTMGGTQPLDPETAPAATVDRFQDSFATLFKRSAPVFDPTNVSKVIPEAGEAIDMDNFLVMALGPAGEKVTYYSLDIVPDVAGKAYQIVGSDGAPVADQLPILEGIPGDAGYNDFVAITKVKVKDGYVANTITSADAVAKAVADGTATEEATSQMVNWSVVPKGTTASRKFLGKTVTGFRAWYKDQVASYLEFETDLPGKAGDSVPTVPIYVIFKNDMSPSEGFATEAMSKQTHNVVGLLPGQPGYSSYWDHFVGDLAGFDTVKDLPTASANMKMKVPVIVNCPVVE